MEEKLHSLVLENREKLTVSCCNEVISFNENEVNLITDSSRLVIKGVNLKVEEVSKETKRAVIMGESIDSIVYSRHVKGSKESLIRRILK